MGKERPSANTVMGKQNAETKREHEKKSIAAVHYKMGRAIGHLPSPCEQNP